MKKILNKAIALACALTCATAGVPASAGVSVYPVAKASSYTALENKAEVTVPVVDNLKFTANDYAVNNGTLSAENTSDIIPFKVTERTALNVLSCTVVATSSALQVTTIGIYKADGTKVIDGKSLSKTEAPTKIGEYDKISMNQVLEAGKYYVKVEGNSISSKVAYIVRMIGYKAPEQDTITLDQTYSAYAAYDEEIYQKVELSNDGMFAVAAYQHNASAYWGATAKREGTKITLCDENKKALSKQIKTTADGNYVTSWALKKGIYYLKVRGTDCYYFLTTAQVAGTVTAAKKAAALPVTGEEKSYILPVDGTKTSAWFTFTVKKPNNTPVNVGFSGEGKVKITIFKDTTTVGSSKKFNNKKFAFYMQGSTSKKKKNWPMGKYYVKVVRTSKKAFGEVKISVK